MKIAADCRDLGDGGESSPPSGIMMFLNQTVRTRVQDLIVQRKTIVDTVVLVLLLTGCPQFCDQQLLGLQVQSTGVSWAKLFMPIHDCARD